METLILYGSAARGENVANSDCDLFAIADSDHHSMIVKNNVNLAVYPFIQCLEMAQNGDLFMMHVVQEGKVLYDRKDYFSLLTTCFQYKKNYAREVASGSDLGWALLQVAHKSNNITLINKRIAWCVRTVLIARTAEEREPIFSASGLAERFNDPAIKDLIENKASDRLDGALLSAFSKFLDKYGKQRPDWIPCDDPVHLSRLLEMDGNVVGAQTMLLVSSGVRDQIY